MRTSPSIGSLISLAVSHLLATDDANMPSRQIFGCCIRAPFIDESNSPSIAVKGAKAVPKRSSDEERVADDVKTRAVEENVGGEVGKVEEELDGVWPSTTEISTSQSSSL